MRALLPRRRADAARKRLKRQPASPATAHRLAATAGTAAWPIGRWVILAVVLTLLGAAGLTGWLLHHRPAEAPEGQALQQLSISELLAGHSASWRIARLKENPAVMAIEFPGLAEQGMAMNRIAALLEKADAPRDRVLDDKALAALITRHGDNAQTFYQGHDYTDVGLARFFALSKAQAVPLNPYELRLQREVTAAGLLSGVRAGAGAGHLEFTSTAPQALITFTALQRDDPATAMNESVDTVRRASVLTHEASHGRFFTQPAYRAHCIRLWREMLDERQRENIRSYLAGIGYDRRNEEMMLNEAQAFLMNTDDTRAFSAAGIGMTEAELAGLRQRFWRSLPAEAADANPQAWPARAESRLQR